MTEQEKDQRTPPHDNDRFGINMATQIFPVRSVAAGRLARREIMRLANK
jgi:hypothetical protein